MSFWLFLIGACGFFFCLFYGLIHVAGRGKRKIGWRLAQLKDMASYSGGSADVLSRPFAERFVRPLFEQVSRWVLQLTPAVLKESLSLRLSQAGYPLGFNLQGFLTFTGVLVVFFPVIGAVLAYFFHLSVAKLIFLIIFGIFFGFLISALILRYGLVRHHTQIQCQLPDVLDLLTVSVEAGLGFDAALAKVVEKKKGALANELHRTLQEIRMGKPKHDALRDLGRRNGVEDLMNFLSAVSQAEQLGVPITSVLRVQSDEMRRRRLQRAEEAAMKVPVKMIFPLVFCVFPALLIVVLGPALIQIFENFAR